MTWSRPGLGVLAAAMIGIAFAAPAQATSADHLSAKPDPVAPGDWETLLVDGGRTVFWQAGPPQGGNPLVWLRFELKAQSLTPGGRTYVSAALLEEADCRTRSLRLRRIHYYAGAKLKGGIVEAADGQGGWTAGADGSVASEIVRHVCGPPRPPHS